MKVLIDDGRCNGCGVCTRMCPQMILELAGGSAQVRDEGRCMGCFGCEDECPTGAVRVLRARPAAEIEIEPPPGGGLSCDVAVVGAGPAGLGAAITCARAGLDVLVLERLPSRKLSHHTDGGMLFTLPWMTSIEVTGDRVTFPELEISIQPGGPAGKGVRPCPSLGLLGPDGLSTDNRMPPGTEGWASDKDRFVEALVGEAGAAGARLWFNAKVADVLRADGRMAGVTLDTGDEVRARVVVAADGAMASISEKAGMAISHDDLWHVWLLAFEYNNATDLPAGLYYLQGGLPFDPGTPGAIAGVGITDVVHVMVGFFARERWYPAAKPLDSYVQRLLEADERVERLVGPAVRGARPRLLNGCRGVFRARCNLEPVGDGVLSVGDAWVDDGELGNVPALANGVYAGRVIVQAARRNDFSREALAPVTGFLDKRLLRALAENKRMKLLGAQLSDEEQRQLFLFMQHLNYPVMLFGTPRQQGMMFAKFMVKNAFRFLRYPRVGRMFF